MPGPIDRASRDLRPVETPTDAEAYWAICDAAYPSLGFPPGLFKEAFKPDDLLDEQRVWACLAYEDGRAVACASVWMTSGVGMVGWVASLPETVAVALPQPVPSASRTTPSSTGADVASLQASPMGEDFYRRLGYEEIFSYRLLGAMPG